MAVAWNKYAVWLLSRLISVYTGFYLVVITLVVLCMTLKNLVALCLLIIVLHFMVTEEMYKWNQDLYSIVQTKIQGKTKVVPNRQATAGGGGGTSIPFGCSTSTTFPSTFLVNPAAVPLLSSPSYIEDVVDTRSLNLRLPF